MKTCLLDALDRNTIDRAAHRVEHALKPYTVRRAERENLRVVRDELYLIVHDAPIEICDGTEDGVYERLFDALSFLTSALQDYQLDTAQLECCLIALRQVQEEWCGN